MKFLVTPASFLNPENAEARALLERYADEVVYNDTGAPLDEGALTRRLQNVDAYIAGLDRISAGVVEQMPASLKVISRYGVGYDRIDLAACAKRGIVVTNTPGANANAVSELAFGLMLCLARDIPGLHRAVEAGKWPCRTGMELAGKTLGILGLGAIGRNLAAKAKAFQMEVLACDPKWDAEFAEKAGIGQVSFNELLRRSDIVSLHLPLGSGTQRLISHETIGQMKTGAILINTSRGGLLDEDAVAEALQDGRLGGLGLDAFETEPPPGASALLHAPHVVFTPHTGAHTTQAIQRMGRLSVENALLVLRGEACAYVVSA